MAALSCTSCPLQATAFHYKCANRKSENNKPGGYGRNAFCILETFRKQHKLSLTIPGASILTRYFLHLSCIPNWAEPSMRYFILTAKSFMHKAKINRSRIILQKAALSLFYSRFLNREKTLAERRRVRNKTIAHFFFLP